MERNARHSARRTIVLRDDHRPERGHIARLCNSASGTGRRKCRHPRPRGCKRRCSGQRGVRRQRQSDADRDGGRGRRAKPDRAACFLRDRSHCPPVPDGPSAISAALRAGEHRVHDCGRHGRHRGGSRDGPGRRGIQRASGASTQEAPGPLAPGTPDHASGDGDSLPPSFTMSSLTTRSIAGRSLRTPPLGFRGTPGLLLHGHGDQRAAGTSPRRGVFTSVPCCGRTPGAGGA